MQELIEMKIKTTLTWRLLARDPGLRFDWPFPTSPSVVSLLAHLWLQLVYQPNIKLNSKRRGLKFEDAPLTQTLE